MREDTCSTEDMTLRNSTAFDSAAMTPFDSSKAASNLAPRGFSHHRNLAYSPRSESFLADPNDSDPPSTLFKDASAMKSLSAGVDVLSMMMVSWLDLEDKV